MKFLSQAGSAALALALSAGNALGQTPPPSPAASQPSSVSLTITGEAGQKLTLAFPQAIAPLAAEIQQRLTEPFQATLADDLTRSFFVLADAAQYPKGARPPATREQADAWMASGAKLLLDTQILPDGEKVSVVAQLYDLRDKDAKSIFGRRYSGEAKGVKRIAHTLANDLVKLFTGRSGPFLTRLAFVSDRDGGGNKEVYLMDMDGDNQRRLTYHKSLSLAPDFSNDSSMIVYQSYLKGQPGLFVLPKEGGQTRQIPVTTTLNASPSFSPDAKLIAYCGSVRGNPEIFSVALDGSNQNRLTESSAIDSTPRFAPNGRELVFTSNRQGTPQIYTMDVDGTNVKKLTDYGNWNDEAAFSPDGSKVAHACRNDRQMQICITDRASGRTFQITNSEGMAGNPVWSPDGSLLAFELQRGKATQIVVTNADGSNMRTLTSAGNNYSPAWSKTLE